MSFYYGRIALYKGAVIKYVCMYLDELIQALIKRSFTACGRDGSLQAMDDFITMDTPSNRFMLAGRPLQKKA